MLGGAAAIHAADISVTQTLALLDGQFSEVAVGVAEAKYALWLGSGISRERVDELRVVVRRVVDHLSAGARAEAGVGGPYKTALNDAIELALTAAERPVVDQSVEPALWPNVAVVIERLIEKYAKLLDIRIVGKESDFLVWDVVDVCATYGSVGLEPDCEHNAIALLVMEGVVPKMASANWDGLIEKAVSRISNDNANLLKVFVRAEDIPGANGRSYLHKFHGCAVKARADQANYRPYIVGRQEQIDDWGTDPRNALMKNQLQGISAAYCTLMIGLSAQDSNIKNLFAEARQMHTWPWPAHPPGYVFAEEQLGADQGTMLKSVYHDSYDANQAAIKASARIGAFGKPLLTALVLSVLGQKVRKLIELVPAANLNGAARTRLNEGAVAIRDGVAAQGGTTSDEKRALMNDMISGLTRGLAIFRGDIASVTNNVYGAIGAVPIQQIATDPNLAVSGMPELASLLGLVGLGTSTDGWTVSQPGGAASEGSVLITSPATAGAQKVFVVLNDEILSRLVSDGVVDDSDPDTIVVVCSAPPTRRTRNPSAIFGRDDSVVSRELSFKALLGEAANADHLLARFKEEATL